MSGTGYDLTATYALKKPWINADNDQWGVHNNSNMDALDTLLAQNLARGPFVPVAGGVTMTGILTLSADPVATNDAATKHYVDNATPPGGPFAPIASPALTGIPTTPNAAPGTSTTQIASTAFVGAAVAASHPGVSSFNTRGGAVTLLAADVSGVGGALLASPAFTGTPTAPTAAPATNTTQIASTAFVAAALAGSVAGVASFNTRTGVVTLQATDVTGVGGALLASPAFTGTPTVPTATAGTATTQIASTAFVGSAVSAGVPPPSSTTPIMDGTAAVGTGTTFARADHVHPTDTTRAPIAGVTNGSNAAAGQVGEYITASRLTNLSMTNNTPVNITTLALTAGDWDVAGNVSGAWSAGGGNLITAINLTSASIVTPGYDSFGEIGLSVANLAAASVPAGPTRISLAAPATVYLVGQTNFVSGTCTVQGTLRARRIR